MKELKIDPELRDLLPPLTDDEFKRLENNILEGGFDKNFPIMEWKGYIADGHNRYSICKKHGIEPVIGTLAYETKEEVMAWMLDIQLGRRNLSAMQRIAVAEKYRPIYEKQARERQSEAGGDKKSESYQKSLVPNLAQAENKIQKPKTIEKLANIADVGKETYRQGVKILNSDNEEVKKKVMSGEMSINAGYKEITKKDIPEKNEISKPTIEKQDKPTVSEETKQICENLKTERTKEYIESIWDYKIAIISCMNADFDSFYDGFVSTLSEMDTKVSQEELNECVDNAQSMINRLQNAINIAKENTELREVE